MLRRVLHAYTIRNPEIGYCQCFSFIVGRLIRIMSEEEAFWTMCAILETYLPIDYFQSNMLGAMLDTHVLDLLIK